MTTKEWKKKLTDEWLNQPGIKEVYDIDLDKTFDEQFSAVSIESMLFYALAFGLMVLEKIVGDRITKLEEYFNRLRPHTLRWYAEKIKAFQLDYTLPADTDVYSEINEDARVIKYCSLTERNGVLSAKIAGQKDGKPSKLEESVVEKASEYISRIKDAGVKVLLSSEEADKFAVELLIHYDPLKSVSDDDVKKAISAYLESMPFDGVYSNMALIDVIQKIDGVRVAEVLSSQAKKHGDNVTKDIDSIYVSASGYMEIVKAIIELKPYQYDQF